MFATLVSHIVCNKSLVQLCQLFETSLGMLALHKRLLNTDNNALSVIKCKDNLIKQVYMWFITRAQHSSLRMILIALAHHLIYSMSSMGQNKLTFEPLLHFLY